MEKLKRGHQTVDKDGIITTLNLKPYGGGGWYTDKDLTCPECHKNGGKFGIKFIELSGLVNCWKCGYKSSIAKFLHIQGLDRFIFKEKRYTLTNTKLESVIKAQQPEASELPEQKLPYGFKLIESDEYLDSRGFTSEQYKLYGIGITDSPLETGWNDKVIFQIYQKGKRVGVLGRSRRSKEWHDANLIEHKEHGKRLILRYKNSDTDFSHILGNHDTITPQTDTVFIVEGLFDAANMDRLLETSKQAHTRNVFVFGSSISKKHIELLRCHKNVQKTVLLFDADALKKMKRYVSELQANFDYVYIGVLSGDIDPAKLDNESLAKLLENMQTPEQFYTTLTPNKIKQ